MGLFDELKKVAAQKAKELAEQAKPLAEQGIEVVKQKGQEKVSKALENNPEETLGGLQAVGSLQQAFADKQAGKELDTEQVTQDVKAVWKAAKTILKS